MASWSLLYQRSYAVWSVDIKSNVVEVYGNFETFFTWKPMSMIFQYIFRSGTFGRSVLWAHGGREDRVLELLTHQRGGQHRDGVNRLRLPHPQSRQAKISGVNTYIHIHGLIWESFNALIYAHFWPAKLKIRLIST